jgi:hypothetical protein
LSETERRWKRGGQSPSGDQHMSFHSNSEKFAIEAMRKKTTH